MTRGDRLQTGFRRGWLRCFPAWSAWAAACGCAAVLCWAPVSVAQEVSGMVSVSEPGVGGPSRPARVEPLVTVALSDSTMEEAAKAVGRVTNQDIVVYGGAQGKTVQLMAKNLPFSEAMNLLCIPDDLVWWKMGEGVYAIADYATFTRVALEDADMAAALDALSGQFPLKWEWVGEVTVALRLQTRLLPERGGPAAVVGPLGITKGAADATSDSLVTIAFGQARLLHVAAALRAQTTRAIYPRGFAYNARVDVTAQNVPLWKALDELATRNNLVWWQSWDGSIGIGSPEYFKRFVVESDAFEQGIKTVARGQKLEWWKVSEIEYRIGRKEDRGPRRTESRRTAEPVTVSLATEAQPSPPKPTPAATSTPAPTPSPEPSPTPKPVIASPEDLLNTWEMLAVLDTMAMFKNKRTDEEFALTLNEEKTLEADGRSFVVKLEGVDMAKAVATVSASEGEQTSSKTYGLK